MQSKQPNKFIGKKGKNWWVNGYGKVYVQGMVDGKFIKKSTKKTATASYLREIERTHREVLLQLIDKTEVKSKTEKQNDNIMFVDYAEEIMELTSVKRIEHSQKGIKSSFNKHTKPYFQYFRLKDVIPNDIERWEVQTLKTVVGKDEDGKDKTMAPATLKKLRDFVDKVFEKAEANRLIDFDPSKRADRTPVPKAKKLKPYTELEIKLMIENSSGWLNILLLIAFSTGLRVGELIGLQWDDINWEHGYIDLKRSISAGSINESNEYKNHERMVSLPDVTLKRLSEYKLHEAKSDTWVFVTSRGKYFKTSSSIIRNHFKPLLFELGIEYRELKTTRSTFISLLINKGINLRWIKDNVGHSQSSTMTEEDYYTFEKNPHDTQAVNNLFMFPKNNLTKNHTLASVESEKTLKKEGTA